VHRRPSIWQFLKKLRECLANIFQIARYGNLFFHFNTEHYSYHICVGMYYTLHSKFSAWKIHRSVLSHLQNVRST